MLICFAQYCHNEERTVKNAKLLMFSEHQQFCIIDTTKGEHCSPLMVPRLGKNSHIFPFFFGRRPLVVILVIVILVCLDGAQI